MLIILFRLQILILMSTLNALVGVVIYYGIIKNRGSNSSSLISYGLIFPLVICVAVLPLRALLYLGLHNTAQMTAVAGSLTILTFRCMMGKYVES